MNQAIKKGLIISFIILGIVISGLFSYAPHMQNELSVPEPDKIQEPSILEPQEPSVPEIPGLPTPEFGQCSIVRIDIDYNLHGTHGFMKYYTIKRGSDGYYSNKGQKVDPALVYGLELSFTDFYESQRYERFGNAIVLGDYKEFRVRVELKNGKTLVLDTVASFEPCCTIPWNIWYNGKTYIQFNGQIPTAIFRILREVDEEIRRYYEKEARWGCYPAVVYYEHASTKISEDFPQSRYVTSLLEEEGSTHVVWKADLGVSASPVYAARKLFIITTNSLLALDAVTGETVWEFTEEGTVSKNVIVHEGAIYTAGPSTIYQLDAQSGDILSKYTFDNEIYMEGFNSDKDKLIVVKKAPVKEIVCLDIKTGKEVWKISGDFSRINLFDDKIFIEVNTDNGGYFALVDSNTGTILWKQDSSPLRYCLYNDHILYFDNWREGRLIAFDTATRKEWSYTYERKLPEGHRTHLYRDRCQQGILLTILEEGINKFETDMVYLDKTGSILWEYHFDEVLFPINEECTVFQDVLFLRKLEGGFVQAFNIKNGKKVWENEIRGYIESFQIFGDRLYIAADDCRLYCLDVYTGQILWELVICDIHCIIHLDTGYECDCDRDIYDIIVEVRDGIIYVAVKGVLFAVAD